ncbi:lysine biosynthesis protein LysW [Actinocrispum wychmicini]|uniref:Alpha-aminoadipate carrier protein LysW n=1 Tax=Actinocrispum wychmicini TaxID=1213861 RepID=A0A4V2S6D6_9PSEU|nr:lysine biosynthesis protein LysW [Actinocrispum wychmicini]TCO55610.1 alpha-aminoadipate carrier protein LysW [Actinocrispum wychmicini]
MVSCPECSGAVEIQGDPRPSQILECGSCRSELEVLTVLPLMVALAPEIEEDWGE